MLLKLLSWWLSLKGDFVRRAGEVAAYCPSCLYRTMRSNTVSPRYDTLWRPVLPVQPVHGENDPQLPYRLSSQAKHHDAQFSAVHHIAVSHFVLHLWGKISASKRPAIAEAATAAQPGRHWAFAIRKSSQGKNFAASALLGSGCARFFVEPTDVPL